MMSLTYSCVARTVPHDRVGRRRLRPSGSDHAPEPQNRECDIAESLKRRRSFNEAANEIAPGLGGPPSPQPLCVESTPGTSNAVWFLHLAVLQISLSR